MPYKAVQNEIPRGNLYRPIGTYEYILYTPQGWIWPYRAMKFGMPKGLIMALQGHMNLIRPWGGYGPIGPYKGYAPRAWLWPYRDIQIYGALIWPNRAMKFDMPQGLDHGPIGPNVLNTPLGWLWPYRAIQKDMPQGRGHEPIGTYEYTHPPGVDMAI